MKFLNELPSHSYLKVYVVLKASVVSICDTKDNCNKKQGLHIAMLGVSTSLEVY